MNDPLVSVYMTAYNQENLIEGAILSAINQDYENLQVVVSDDASTDSTPAILRAFAAKYPGRLKVHFNEENLGIVKNHEVALGLCGGEFVASLDGDDIFLPGKIRKQVDFMRGDEECIIGYHDCEVVDGDTGERLYYWTERYGRREGGAGTLVRYGIFMCSPTVMVRRKHIPANGFIEGLTTGGDWFLWIQTLANGEGKIKYLDESLAQYRRHTGNVTLDWDAKLDSRFQTLDMVEKKYPRFRSAARNYRSDLLLMRSIRKFSRGAYLQSFQTFAVAFVYAFPYFWNVFRIPLREIAFMVKNGLERDDLIRSLFR